MAAGYTAGMRAAAIVVLCLSSLLGAQTPAPANIAASDARPGFVFYEGRWRLPGEVAYLKKAASLRTAQPAAAAAAPAENKTPRAAAGNARPNRAKAAPAKTPKRAAPASRPLSRSRATGLFTIRAQQTRLLGFDTVTVGLGNGQARLMLPRTESVSIGTTIGVPLR